MSLDSRSMPQASLSSRSQLEVSLPRRWRPISFTSCHSSYSQEQPLQRNTVSLPGDSLRPSLRHHFSCSCACHHLLHIVGFSDDVWNYYVPVMESQKGCGLANQLPRSPFRDEDHLLTAYNHASHFNTKELEPRGCSWVGSIEQVSSKTLVSN